jgi:colanic acid biosynthesis glycosyl transferase WcaI
VCVVHDVQSGLASGLGMVRNDRLVDVMRAVERRALGVADELLVLSDEMANGLRSMGVRTPISVLPLWSTIEPPPAGPGAVTDLQFSGNLGRKQGLEQLVALIAGLRRVRPATTCTIRGAGPMRDAIQARLDAEGLGIEVEPPVANDDLPLALASSRVHVVPQLAATAEHVVPSKIVNALAAGGAVLAMASPRSPIARMAAECDAIKVVEPDDIDGAVAAARILLDVYKPADLRAAALAYATEHHDRDRLLHQLHATLVGDRRIA